jgi:hypothetical protein
LSTAGAVGCWCVPQTQTKLLPSGASAQYGAKNTGLRIQLPLDSHVLPFPALWYLENLFLAPVFCICKMESRLKKKSSPSCHGD